MKTDSEIIDAFGGNREVARICSPTLPEVVSGWRKRGIPRSWKALLMNHSPNLFLSECDGSRLPAHGPECGASQASLST